MRVALIGCGRWGSLVLRDLRSLGCEVPVVARSEQSIARAAEGGAATIAATIAELPQVDAVVVATTTSTHVEVLDEVLPLEVPVFVEKPLCPDPAAAARLAAVGDGRLFVMDKWRYHPGVELLGELARSRRLGAVRGLRTVRIGWGTSHDDVDGIWVLAPHDLSIALEILGSVPDPVAAAGGIDPGGSVVLHALMDVHGVWHVAEVSDRSAENRRRVELYCDEGTAVLAGGWDEHISLYRLPGSGEPEAERVEACGELPLLAELRAFVEHLQGGPPPRSSAAEGVAVVEAIARLRTMAGLG